MARFKVGDVVVSVCKVRKGQTGYGSELTVIEVSSYGPSDNYYNTTNGGCFHDRDKDLVEKEIWDSPLYKALQEDE